MANVFWSSDLSFIATARKHNSMIFIEKVAVSKKGHMGLTWDRRAILVRGMGPSNE